MLKVARQLLGESQESLAKKLGLTKKAIERVEQAAQPSSNERHGTVAQFFESQGFVFKPPGGGEGWSVVQGFRAQDKPVPPRIFAAARVGLDESQPTLAKKANLGRATVSRIETGATTVHQETKLFLLEYFSRHGVHVIHPEDSTKGWGLSFDFLDERPAARHPRPNLQRRKQFGSGQSDIKKV